MPAKKVGPKTQAIIDRTARLPKVPDALLDAFMDGQMTAAGVAEATASFKRALIERVLSGEMTHHLGYLPGEKPPESSNHRNGTTSKSVLTGDGPMRIDVPRDREGTFEPLLVPKHVRRFTGFDEQIIRLYARGMTVREIQGFMAEQYNTQVSHDFISTVTDEVLSEVAEWQNRPLDSVIPVVFFDALRVKIKDEAVVRSKAVYVALGIMPDGRREILGLWVENTEGAKFWLKVFNDLKTRGLNDILIAVTDGLKGISESLGTVFPKTTLQTCIVHLIRNSLEHAGWRDRKGLAQALRPIYTAVNAEAAERALEEFDQSAWGRKFPQIAASWRRVWDRVIPFFAYPPAVRRLIYTTNAIESLNAQLRKIIKTRSHFPNDDAALKLLWLTIQRLGSNLTVRDWREAMNQFEIQYPDRFNRANL
jgi:putative transposase